MIRTSIETQVLDELRHLSQEQAQEALDFILFLRSRVREQKSPFHRPIGLMQGKAACHIAEDFSITDEELLQL